MSDFNVFISSSSKDISEEESNATFLKEDIMDLNNDILYRFRSISNSMSFLTYLSHNSSKNFIRSMSQMYNENLI